VYVILDMCVSCLMGVCIMRNCKRNCLLMLGMCVYDGDCAVVCVPCLMCVGGSGGDVVLVMCVPCLICVCVSCLMYVCGGGGNEVCVCVCVCHV